MLNLRTILAAVAFVVAVCAFVAASLRVSSTNDAIEHTTQVKLAISQFRSDIIQADKVVEDYVIAGNPERLQAFERVKTSFESSLARVRELTSDSPSQQALVRGIDERVSPRFAVLRGILTTRGKAGRDAAIADFETYLNSRGLENRAAFQALAAEEDRLMELRRAAGREANVASLVSASLAGVFLAVLAAFGLSDRRAEEQAKLTVEARRLQLEAENSQLAQRAEVVDFQERFIAILGHDLRNPLGAVTMGIDLLKRETSGEEATLRRMTSSSQRMARMIDQLLDLTRSRLAGGIALTPSATDLGKLTNDLVDELRPQRPEATLEIEAKGDLKGEWDTDRLAQVISNLVGNALNHGTAQKPVSITLDGTGASVIFSIHNAGKTIDKDLQRVLFDPFRRGDKQGNSAKTAGVGLGLFISREIVTRHGGTIEVASTDAAGTTFTFTLPRRVPSALSPSITGRQTESVDN